MKYTDDIYLYAGMAGRTVKAFLHYLHCDGLSQVLSGLCLASAGRASWSTAQIEMHCTHEGHIAPVSEGRDDETGCVTQVLIAVDDRSLQDRGR